MKGDYKEEMDKKKNGCSYVAVVCVRFYLPPAIFQFGPASEMYVVKCQGYLCKVFAPIRAGLVMMMDFSTVTSGALNAQQEGMTLEDMTNCVGR
jgi:hypothetical protein